MESDKIKIYSDGSYIIETNQSGYCVLIEYPDLKKEYITGSNHTENKKKNYEVYALYQTIKIIKEKKLFNSIIFTDSLQIIFQLEKIKSKLEISNSYKCSQKYLEEIFDFISFNNIEIFHIRSKKNLADQGSRFSAYQETKNSVEYNKNKVGNFLNISNLLYVENCLADNVAKSFIKRRKKTFYNYFNKNFICIHLEKQEEFFIVSFYRKNEIIHTEKVLRKNDFNILEYVLNKKELINQRKLLITSNSLIDFMNLVYKKNEIKNIAEADKIKRLIEKYEQVCFLDNIKLPGKSLNISSIYNY